MQNETMFAEERKVAIVKYVNEHKKCKVGELCDIFKVSSATIRNDLNELENAGLLKRTHGGAIPVGKAQFELNSYQKKVERIAQKRAIAKKALEWVEDGDAIAIDTGTTTLCFAELLPARKDLTVVTNDIEIASVLEEKTDANVILIGGRLRRGFHCSVGAIAHRCMEGLNVDKAFIATNGISIKNGLTTPNEDLAQMKSTLISIAKQAILLCDSTKFGQTSFARFADLDDIDAIVTDAGLAERQKHEYEQLDLQLDIAELIQGKGE